MRTVCTMCRYLSSLCVPRAYHPRICALRKAGDNASSLSAKVTLLERDKSPSGNGTVG